LGTCHEWRSKLWDLPRDSGILQRLTTWVYSRVDGVNRGSKVLHEDDQ
jgi:hypothetical protein